MRRYQFTHIEPSEVRKPQEESQVANLGLMRQEIVHPYLRKTVNNISGLELRLIRRRKKMDLPVVNFIQEDRVMNHGPVESKQMPPFSKNRIKRIKTEKQTCRAPGQATEEKRLFKFEKKMLRLNTLRKSTHREQHLVNNKSASYFSIDSLQAKKLKIQRQDTRSLERKQIYHHYQQRDMRQSSRQSIWLAPREVQRSRPRFNTNFVKRKSSKISHHCPMSDERQQKDTGLTPWFKSDPMEEYEY